MPGIDQVEEVLVPARRGGRMPVELPGTLAVPSGVLGVVVFAHGSGSSRHSGRNILVAARLRTAQLGTLLFDLLTDEEAEDRARVFDIGLLAERLAAAAEFVRSSPAATGLPIGYFGASTGAAAALVAAAGDSGIAAVVSRGGRPDLAGHHLKEVRSPTLLIVGGADHGVIELNERALAALSCEKRLEIIPGATHLFEEPGALDQVAVLARDWFARHMGGGGAGTVGDGEG